jgi:hypothetical protein
MAAAYGSRWAARSRGYRCDETRAALLLAGAALLPLAGGLVQPGAAPTPWCGFCGCVTVAIVAARGLDVTVRVAVR